MGKQFTAGSWVLACALALWISAALPAVAEVRIEVFDHRVPHPAPTSAAPGTQAQRSLTAATRPAGDFWFVPSFRVDTTSFGDTTLWSARNETNGLVTLLAQYFDLFFQSLGSQNFALAPGAMATVNVRDVAGLAVDPDGFARGFVRLQPTGGAISADVMQVDTANNFATGNAALILDDFCTQWQARFLSFGAGQGSMLSLLINGPRGSGAGDPPSVFGDVFDENGNFINSFVLRTDQWILDVPALDFVLGGVSFGAMELTLDAVNFPDGLVSVSHTAEGRFSAGLPAVCLDSP